jgi:branched-chain amino acid transport system ATP-binding protein
MLEVENLWVRYGRVPAVRGVSFDVAEGELVGLIGPNGAGKTSSLKACVGLLPFADGDVRLEGRSLAGKSPQQVLDLGMALVPEGRQVFGSLTVAENLQVGATTRRRDAGVATEIEDLLTSFPGLRKHYRAHAGRLSGGEQQQLAIARALLARPRLLILDEPSLGLAPKMVDTVFEVLKDLRTRGITVLLVEQNVVRAMEFVDRFYVLRAGEVATSATHDSLADEDDLMHTYLGL